MDLTFIFPCLDEEKTLSACIRSVRAALDNPDCNIIYEIVVADNGSTDNSPQIAIAESARLISVEGRGYGAALKGGIAAAKGKYVMFADADNTYLYEHALLLYNRAVRSGADMAIASRITGCIELGAMPRLHRWIGTPLLTWAINMMFDGKLSDINSGFRCIRKSAYENWNIRSDGMEFASETIIKALKCRASLVEISSGLRCGDDDRIAHLETWRDGMRHLLLILSERPRLFEWSGMGLVFLSLLLQSIAVLLGPTSVFDLNIFDVHSGALLLLLGVSGMQMYIFSCVMFLNHAEEPTLLTNRLLKLGETELLLILLASVCEAMALVIVVVITWILGDFSGLDIAAKLIGCIHIVVLSMMLAIGLLGVHVFQRS